MSFSYFLYRSSEVLLFLPFVFLLIGSIVLSFKTRFVQIRAIPKIIKLFCRSLFSKATDDENTIRPHRALFTAMSTSLGIGNIVSPIIAIGLGGPGALLGFFLATIFGCAATFTEVTFSLFYRERLHDGTVMGGPMQYLKKEFGNALALFYAFFVCIMLVAWSGRQSNTLALLMKSHGIPQYVSGIIVALLVTFILIKGIKAIGSFSAKIVPIMFVLYVGSMLWIILSHSGNIIPALKLIFVSAFTPKALMGAGVGLGFQKAMRWGLSNAVFSNEAGLGTASIPHSMAEVENPVDQGIISMATVYTNGFLCILSGLAILVTGVWQKPGAIFDITMLSRLLTDSFSSAGSIILIFTVLLFVVGTILGNSYNGSQGFLFVTKNKWIWYYYILIALVVFVSSIADMNALWAIGDYLMVLVAVPHTIGIVILAFRRSKLLKIM
jgi:alanine or glycine:cation symporter, AGCS family